MARCVTAAQKHVQEVAEAMMGSVDSSSIVQVASCDRLTTLLQVGVCLCLCVCVCVCALPSIDWLVPPSIARRGNASPGFLLLELRARGRAGSLHVTPITRFAHPLTREWSKLAPTSEPCSQSATRTRGISKDQEGGLSPIRISTLTSPPHTRPAPSRGSTGPTGVCSHAQPWGVTSAPLFYLLRPTTDPHPPPPLHQDATTAVAVDAALPAYEAPVVRSCLTLLASARATTTQAATLRVLGHLLGRSDAVLQYSGAAMGTSPCLPRVDHAFTPAAPAAAGCMHGRMAWFFPCAHHDQCLLRLRLRLRLQVPRTADNQ